MIIEVQGGSKKRKELAASLAEFCARKFMPRMSDSIYLKIDIIRNLLDKEGVHGDCEWMDTDYRPKEFTIRLNSGDPDQEFFETLAHEMVHLKQFAKDELKYKCDNTTRYNKTVYPENISYWDMPWEIEAHGRERGLVVMWEEERKKK